MGETGEEQKNVRRKGDKKGWTTARFPKKQVRRKKLWRNAEDERRRVTQFHGVRDALCPQLSTGPIAPPALSTRK